MESEALAPTDVVHLLTFGVAKCKRVRGLPFQWPPGHTWRKTREELMALPTANRCPACMRR